MAASRRASSVASDERIAQTLQEEYDTEVLLEGGSASTSATNALQVQYGTCRTLDYTDHGGLSSKVFVTGVSAPTNLMERGCDSTQVPMAAERNESSDRGRLATCYRSTPLLQRNPLLSELPLIPSGDHSDVDIELACRLHELDSIPHLPKVNGVIPSEESANADHQRLLYRLSLYGLTELRIAGDGNCQFRALSDQLYRSPDHHQFVRDKIVFQLTNFVEKYSGYVPMSYNEYLNKMANDGEWGDHVTLQAAADYYGVKISLITSFRDRSFVEIMPSTRKSAREIYLSFWAEVHYNSIYPIGDSPGCIEDWLAE